MRNKNLRMCCACREHKKKEELLRFVVLQGNLKFDATYKVNSRGYYVCNNLNCINKVQKNKFFNNILKRNVREDELEEIASCFKK